MKSILPPSRKHDITIHPSGKIDISARIARRLALSPGDIIDIAEEEGEWYIYVKLRAGTYTGAHEGRVWPTNKSGGTFRLSSRPIAAAVLAAAGVQSRLRLPCGAEILREGTIYITLIYRYPL